MGQRTVILIFTVARSSAGPYVRRESIEEEDALGQRHTAPAMLYCADNVREGV
jgi:hypothetical protein